MTRLSAREIETIILRTVRDHTDSDDEHRSLTSEGLIQKSVERVVVGAKQVTITLKSHPAPLAITWTPKNRQNLAHVEQEATNQNRPAPNPKLVQAIVHARIWLKSLSDGTYSSIDDLARAANLHPKVIRHRIRLAFLAPAIVSEIVDGTPKAPAKLVALAKVVSLSWDDQRRGLRG